MAIHIYAKYAREMGHLFTAGLIGCQPARCKPILKCNAVGSACIWRRFYCPVFNIQLFPSLNHNRTDIYCGICPLSFMPIFNISIVFLQQYENHMERICIRESHHGVTLMQDNGFRTSLEITYILGLTLLF